MTTTEVEDTQAHPTRERLNELTDALQSVADSLDRDESMDVLLQQACQQLLNVVPGADMVSVTLFRNGTPETAACTETRVAEIDRKQYEAGDGPCIEAATTGKIVRVFVEQAGERWPAFTESATAAGAKSYLSAPLVIDERHSGALNLYSEAPHGYRESETALLELYVVAVECALRATARYLAARESAEKLRANPAAEPVIERAVGVIMNARGLDASTARTFVNEQAELAALPVEQLAGRVLSSIASAP